ncbi:unnamed protein product [Cylicocyclus nassatus]|uniref:Battenin n=1 Tax=Cylicocyclus nassatus TaxID=53992 RepID=A0AA36H1H1_CYLNA|nr:unnamed protein product [Cylicocyclus nassatus]
MLQVCYHIGVFISRSSTNVVTLNLLCLSLTAIIQTSFATIFFFTAIYAFIPHFGIVAFMMFTVGIIGGANYANTFYHIHRKVDPTIREFALYGYFCRHHRNPCSGPRSYTTT